MLLLHLIFMVSYRLFCVCDGDDVTATQLRMICQTVISFCHSFNNNIVFSYAFMCTIHQCGFLLVACFVKKTKRKNQGLLKASNCCSNTEISMFLVRSCASSQNFLDLYKNTSSQLPIICQMFMSSSHFSHISLLSVFHSCIYVLQAWLFC